MYDYNYYCVKCNLDFIFSATEEDKDNGKCPSCKRKSKRMGIVCNVAVKGIFHPHYNESAGRWITNMSEQRELEKTAIDPSDKTRLPQKDIKRKERPSSRILRERGITNVAKRRNSSSPRKFIV